MKPTIFAGSANTPLAEAVATKLDIRLSSREVQVFPDGAEWSERVGRPAAAYERRQ